MLPLRTNARSRGLPWVTLALITGCGVVFVYELRLPATALDDFLRAWAITPRGLRATLAANPGDVAAWGGPLVGSAFLHGGWGHLLGNMLFLWVFGDAVEARLGSLRYALFYGISAVGAASAQVAFDPSSEVPVVGASGAIAGVLGGFFVLFPRAKVTLLSPVALRRVEIPAVIFLGLWLIQQIFFGTVAALTAEGKAAGGVAWWAHVGGFVSGIVLLAVLLEKRR